jgi:ABC-type multidrug transport system fused ATPase/permease subunit
VDEPTEESLVDLSWYSLLSVLTVLFLMGRILIFRYVSLKVSRTFHSRALWAVLRTPAAFLDTTPTGRIINRFSSDMQRVDMDLRYSTAGFVDQLTGMLLAIVVASMYVPALFVVVFPLLFLYNSVQRRFRATARELQRLFSRSKSPIYQGFDEAMAGVSTIRAFQKQAHFIQRNREKVDINIRLVYSLICTNRWLALRLRAIGTLPVAVIVLMLVFQRSFRFSFTASVSGGLAGLVLRYALQFTQSMEGILQCLTQTELSLVALERVGGYAKLEPEAELTESGDAGRLSAWPCNGTISFEGVVMRYRPELRTVLNGVTFEIAGGTSVGVVGRTGAGKSSLLQAIFRMCPLDAGLIRIDGEDISRVGLHTLRRRLAIIPQDPIGFTGSIRFNLDPFGEHDDAAVLEELRKVQLMDFVDAQGLEYHLTAGGENLSVGQRQLVCAARAFLRSSKILILDEATASVDYNTDGLIQEVLRGEVERRKLTTLTIAHRINTILGADNVLIMDKGLVAEFGPTAELALDPTSRFYTFVHPSKGPDEGELTAQPRSGSATRP